MNIYVLDVARFDPTRPPRNVREERYVVFATLAGDVPCVCQVRDREGQELFVGDWTSAERIGLYEQIRAADRNWNALGATIGRDDNAPGRVA